MSIFGMFREAKDSVVSSGAESIIRGLVRPYGELLSLQIDSGEKRISLRVMLKGEREPVAISVRGYQVECEDGCGYVSAEDVSASRAWISNIADRFITGRWFKVTMPVALGLRCLC